MKQMEAKDIVYQNKLNNYLRIESEIRSYLCESIEINKKIFHIRNSEKFTKNSNEREELQKEIDSLINHQDFILRRVDELKKDIKRIEEGSKNFTVLINGKEEPVVSPFEFSYKNLEDICIMFMEHITKLECRIDNLESENQELVRRINDLEYIGHRLESERSEWDEDDY